MIAFVLASVYFPSQSAVNSCFDHGTAHFSAKLLLCHYVLCLLQLQFCPFSLLITSANAGTLLHACLVG